MLRPRQLFANLAQLADQPRRILDGIHPRGRVRRMAGRTLHLTAHCQLALVPQHRLEFGRLADQAQARLAGPSFEGREQGTHAQAADLLVIGERQVNGHPQRLREKRGHRRQH
ncbi:hypothetical protein D3C80_1649270 [compost metagenome]